MASPFPGMDPYLEASWGDIHGRLVTYSCDAVQEKLPPDLRARMQERVVIAAPEPASFYPDVMVTKPARRKSGRGGGVLVAEPESDSARPILVPRKSRRTETYIEIVEPGSREKLVTVIEVLSPWYKRKGPGRREYLRKLSAIQSSKTSLVEIDLLRRGHRGLPLEAESLPPSIRSSYLASVSRSPHDAALEIYPLPLRERLPRIGIPLRPKDADAVLDLQAIVDLAYKNGRYALAIDYRAEPEPPLSAEDAAWASALLREAGRR